MFSGYTKEFMEKKIYKYYSYDCCLEKMFAPILKNTLRYRRPLSFNDPYDCHITTELNESITSLREHDMETVFVCSLTTNYDNILMWSHYASNHKGFVVEYDMNELRKINEHQVETFSYVEYSNAIPSRKLLVKDSTKDIVPAIYHKALCWGYENEIRSVKYGTPIPIMDTKHEDLELPENAISAVILGTSFIEPIIIGTGEKLPSILKPWYESGKLYYMKLRYNEYKLERKNDFKAEWFA